MKTYKVEGTTKAGNRYRFFVQCVNEMWAQRTVIDMIHKTENSVDTMNVTEATLDEVLRANRILVVTEKVGV